MKRGKFIVVDGLDGVGKGVLESELVRKFEVSGKKVFDSVAWCKANLADRPDVSLLEGYGAVLTAEPTYSGLGLDIRRTLIANRNKERFPSNTLLRAYALDREIQMRGLVVPAMERGVDDIQSRSLVTSLCYQTLNAEDEGRDPVEVRQEILDDPGNVYQLRHAPDLVIIPTIGDIDELVRRLGVRDKNDDAIFEHKEFLERAKGQYESSWLRDILIGAGCDVAYLDAGISIESSRAQVGEIYDDWRATGKVSEKYLQISSS
ncbi:hypothetical protein HNV12_00275 [Methanococcoides sp. SA1]|nr:hypothetical protein [Methanococcoides sp. SA1]